MSDLEAYLQPYGLTNPARMVMRRGAQLLVCALRNHVAGRVLDIGCGRKAKRHLVNEQVTEYVGLDHEASLHDTSHVDLFGTAYSIPQPNASFDSVICTAVLEHLEEPSVALRESFRILKPGGCAVYTVPLFWHLHEEPRDFYRYTKHGLRHLFESVGYQIMDMMPASGFWITFGSEWSYYVWSVARGPLSIPGSLLIAANNLIFPLLDRLDRRLNPSAEIFTWMYLVVARKPQ